MLVILSLHMYYECFAFKLNNNVLSVWKWVFAFAEEFFACVGSCSLQVTVSTRISSLRTVSKATTGPLMNLHSTTMKEVTVVLSF